RRRQRHSRSGPNERVHDAQLDERRAEVTARWRSACSLVSLGMSMSKRGTRDVVLSGKRFLSGLTVAARKLELRTLVLLVVVSVGTLCFVKLADEVREGATRTVDETVLLAMRSSVDLSDPVGPKWFEEAARDFTSF